MEALLRRKRLQREDRGDAIPARRPPRRAFPRVAVLAACLALAGALGLAPAAGPSMVNAMGPLPACRYDDILTSPRQYGDWSTTLVDTILRVSRNYVPPDLVPVSQAGIAGSGQVRAIVIDDLRAMSEAAAAADAAIAVESAYRSYARQQAVFAGWVDFHGYNRALQLSARPGHSEHQLGLGIDFRSQPGGSPFTGSTWASTAAGKWMKAHSWEYGFVMSYPRNKMKVVCYDFEPWHFRYVGRDLAAQVHGSGLTLREYLWANYTTTIVPAVTPAPDRTPRPTKVPIATPPNQASPTTSQGQPTPPPSGLQQTGAAPTLAPSGEPSIGPPPTPNVPSPGADPGPASSLGGGVLAALALALGGGIVLGWMVLRRGRSRVGL